MRHLWNSRFLDTHSQFYQRFPRWRTAFVNGKRRQPGPDSPKHDTPPNPSFVGPHLSREVVTGVRLGGYWRWWCTQNGFVHRFPGFSGNLLMKSRQTQQPEPDRQNSVYTKKSIHQNRDPQLQPPAPGCVCGGPDFWRPCFHHFRPLSGHTQIYTVRCS